MGISTEDTDIIKALAASGVRYTVTATTNGVHAAGSYHYRAGTGGTGLAVDAVGDMAGIQHYFFTHYHNQLAELIGPDVSTLIDQGITKPAPFFGAVTIAAHKNHVHIAVNKGTFLQPKGVLVPSSGEPYVAHCRFKSSKTNDWASAAAKADGSVFCDPPEAYCGGANGQAYFAGRTVRDIVDNHQGGYQLYTVGDVGKYGYPDGSTLV